MTPRCDDWRAWPGEAVEPLIALEVRTWADQLDWDVAEAWSVLEPARASGRLPGFIARDDAGHPIGWTCFLLHRSCLQVIALVAADAGGTRALVEAVLASPQAESADRIILSVRDAAPALAATLAEQGFETTVYRYLARPRGSRYDDRKTPPGVVVRPWAGADAAAIARLCDRAYTPSREVRAFAPNGTQDEWREYIANLLTTPDCGRFLPMASFVVAGRHRGEIDGVVLTTSLGPGTAHIAQLAVDPEVRGRGLGRLLVARALAAVEALEFVRTTLLVSAANQQTIAIYRREGFADRAAFVVAGGTQPRRSSSAALAMGGASTRR